MGELISKCILAGRDDANMRPKKEKVWLQWFQDAICVSNVVSLLWKLHLKCVTLHAAFLCHCQTNCDTNSGDKRVHWWPLSQAHINQHLDHVDVPSWWLCWHHVGTAAGATPRERRLEICPVSTGAGANVLWWRTQKVIKFLQTLCSLWS